MQKATAVLSVVIILAGSGGSLAQSRKENDWCFSSAAKHEETVKGCSALINSGRFTGRYLATVLGNRAIGYNGLEKLDLAAADWEAATRVDPTYVRAWIESCEAFWKAGTSDKAATACNRAVHLDSKNSLHWIRRGDAFLKLGRKNEAVADYSRAITLGPASMWPHVNRGFIYEQRKEYTKAMDDYNAAVRISPNYSGGWENRCSVKIKIGDLRGALSDCKRALEIAPDYYPYNVLQGHAHLKMGDLTNAEDAYRKALSNSLCNSFITKGAHLRAPDAFKELCSPYVDSLYGAGIVKLRKKDATGKSDIERAISLNSAVIDTFATFGIEPR